MPQYIMKNSGSKVEYSPTSSLEFTRQSALQAKISELNLDDSELKEEG